MDYFYIMVVESKGEGTRTATGVVNLEDFATRADVYAHAKAQAQEEFFPEDGFSIRMTPMTVLSLRFGFAARF